MSSVKSSVIQLADYGAPYSGNFIASLLHLEKFLERDGLKQVYIFFGDIEKYQWFNSFRSCDRTVYLLRRNNSPFQLAKKIAEIANIENALIIHSHFTSFDLPSYGAQLLAHRWFKRFNVVWHVHSAFPVVPSLKRKIKDFLKFKIAGRKTRIVYVSEHLLEMDLKRGLRRKRASVILNGIDVERVRGAGEGRESLLRERGIDPGLPTVLMFGWDPETKGVDLAINAFEILFEEGRPATLVIVGEQKLRQFVADRFNSLIPEWLHVLAPEENAAKLFRMTSIFLSASRFEGFSYAVAEAMASGLPVVVSDIPGLSWARHAPAAEFFASGDPYALVAALDRARKRPREEFQANLEFIDAYCSLNAWSQNLVRLYKLGLLQNINLS